MVLRFFRLNATLSSKFPENLPLHMTQSGLGLLEN